MLESWAASDLSGCLRSFGLAPVKVPGSQDELLSGQAFQGLRPSRSCWAAAIRCRADSSGLHRFEALMPEMNDLELKELFEVSGDKLIDMADPATQVGIRRC